MTLATRGCYGSHAGLCTPAAIGGGAEWGIYCKVIMLLFIMEFISNSNMMNVPQLTDWTVLHVLGQGAYGEVRMLLNKRTMEAVAVKVVNTFQGECSDDIKQEICIHKAVKHTNIVRFLDHASDGRMTCLFLEYCSGGDLLDRIPHGVGLEEPHAHRYFLQLIAAVEYLHGLGVTHRDIKPENILLDGRDNLKLSDFGFAGRGTTEVLL